MTVTGEAPTTNMTDRPTENRLASEVTFGQMVRIEGWEQFHQSLGVSGREDCTTAYHPKLCLTGHVKILWACDPGNEPPEPYTWLPSAETVEVLL